VVEQAHDAAGWVEALVVLGDRCRQLFDRRAGQAQPFERFDGAVELVLGEAGALERVLRNVSDRIVIELFADLAWTPQ